MPTKKYFREYRKKNREAIRRYDRKYRKKHVRAFRKYQKSYIRRVKIAVFGHYCKGRIRCQCLGCPIRHIDLLSLDHVKPIKNHIQTNGRTRWRAGKHGWNMWLWVKKKGFPDGFQILCIACNKAKGTKKRCPRYGKKH
jgi:hypothetical protein